MSRVVLSTVLVSLLLAPSVDAQQMARGRVYHDTNFNQAWDVGEKGLAGIRVSNGEDIVRTSKDGSYELSVSDDAILFVIKPAGG